MIKRNTKIALLIVIIAVVLLTVIYNLIDNNRVIVVNQKVNIQNLPKEFEGFTILQISDLHGKQFGKHQQRLLKKINETNYDMLVITGDMDDGSTQDNLPFLIYWMESRRRMMHIS